MTEQLSLLHRLRRMLELEIKRSGMEVTTTTLGVGEASIVFRTDGHSYGVRITVEEMPR